MPSDCASQWRHISTEASQMTADLIVCSTACSDQQQRKSCVLMDLYEGNSLVTSGFISLRANNVVMGHTFPCPDIIITKPQNKTRSYVIHQFLVCSAFYSRPFLVMSLPISVCQSRVCVHHGPVRMITHHSIKLRSPNFNSSPVQARIIIIWREVKNSLVKIRIVLASNWPWRSNLT